MSQVGYRYFQGNLAIDRPSTSPEPTPGDGIGVIVVENGLTSKMSSDGTTCTIGIGSNAVNLNEIGMSRSINAARMGTSAVDSRVLADKSIISSKFTTGCILNDSIAQNAISEDKLDDNVRTKLNKSGGMDIETILPIKSEIVDNKNMISLEVSPSGAISVDADGLNVATDNYTITTMNNQLTQKSNLSWFEFVDNNDFNSYGVEIVSTDPSCEFNNTLNITTINKNHLEETGVIESIVELVSKWSKIGDVPSSSYTDIFLSNIRGGLTKNLRKLYSDSYGIDLSSYVYEEFKIIAEISYNLGNDISGKISTPNKYFFTFIETSEFESNDIIQVQQYLRNIFDVNDVYNYASLTGIKFKFLYTIRKTE